MLRVVGAGVGRTGTLSLKLALERLLGGPCYHMAEVFGHPEHVAVWHAAARGEKVDWNALMSGYVAAVDWPAGAFWPELSEAYPDALILHSTRDAEGWWKSASNTIFPTMETMRGTDWFAMIEALMTERFVFDITNREACIAAFERHNADVQARAPKDRLLEWHPGDGWKPICDALGLPIPDEPFPHVNSSEEFAFRHAQAQVQK